MSGGEVVEFEFEYETPFVAEMPESRQHFFYFFYDFSIPPDYSIAVFNCKDNDEWEDDLG